jgi:hypothetical protein
MTNNRWRLAVGGNKKWLMIYLKIIINHFKILNDLRLTLYALRLKPKA